MMGRDKIINDINTLLTEMSEEELMFVLQQAEVLDHNRKVRLDREEAREQKTDGESGVNSESAQSETTLDAQPPVYIEQTDRSKFFNICIGNARLFVDYQEIQALFKIAGAASSAEEGAPRLYRWFKKERSDVLAEGNIRSPGSPALHEIYEALLETFTSS